MAIKNKMRDKGDKETVVPISTISLEMTVIIMECHIYKPYDWSPIFSRTVLKIFLSESKALVVCMLNNASLFSRTKIIAMPIIPMYPSSQHSPKYLINRPSFVMKNELPRYWYMKKENSSKTIRDK